MGENKGCDLCRYQLADVWENKSTGFYCANEQSENFGKIVTKYGKGGCGCEKYETTDYAALKKMPLKEALKKVIQPDDGSHPSHKFNFGKKNYDFIWTARFFKTNKDLLDYKDALLRLFNEMFKLMEEDGDFQE